MIRLKLTALRPKSFNYPVDLKSIGDHRRKCRLDPRLFQKNVARKVGADVCSVRNGQKGRARPEKRFMSAMADFIV